MSYEILTSFLFASFALAFSPGPDNIFVLTQSIVNGKKYGLATVFGLITGCLVHTTLVAFGVSALIKANENLFFTIKLLGAIYLLYLAYNVFVTDVAISLSVEKVAKKTTGQLFRQGFVMNVLNPKVSIFFLAFFPGFLFSDALGTVAQFYILGFLFMFISLLVFSAIAILAGTISETIKKSSKVGVYLKWMQIIVFVAIAIFILV